MNIAWRYLNLLCDQPHRGSATEAEAWAASRIGQWLREMGYRVESQPFRAPRDTLYLGPSMVIAAVLVAGVVGQFLPALGLSLAVLALLPLIGEMLGSSHLDFDHCLPRFPSQNVLASLPARAKVERTIVITAHYDTQRASVLFHPAVVRWLQPYFGLVYVSLVAIPVTTATRWLAPDLRWTHLVSMAATLFLIATVVLLIGCRLTGRYSNGANDNGSGTALGLALASHFARGPYPDCEFIFLFTGAEEVGVRGIKQFLRIRELDPRSTWVINLDNLGRGTLHYLVGEGMLRYYRNSPALTAVARAVAEGLGTQVREQRNLLLPTDGLIACRAGYQTITFVALDENGALPDYHWYTDLVERIDQDLLGSVEQFLVRYVQRLAQFGVDPDIRAFRT